MQPYVDLYFKLYEGEGFLNKVSLNLGLWSSINSRKTDAGAVSGGKGATRSWVPPEKVTSRTVVRSPACVCGASLLGIPATTGTWARQVVEVPTLLPDVTEYVFETVRCPCCSRLNAPDVPPEAATCTGPNLTALAATLVGEYLLLLHRDHA